MGMAVGSGGGDDEGESVSDINVTPMVDVLLCLLIIFMISQPSSPNQKIPLNVPKSAVVQQPDDPKASLLVTLDPAGAAKLGTDPLSSDYAEMVEQFRRNEKAQADGKIVIAADEKTKYQSVVRIMTAAREAGVEQIGIASERL